ncbi:MAG: response regulator [Hasllibacter sp.]
MSALRVLAVDDSRTMRDLLALALREAGFDPVLAEDGVDAMARIGEVRPAVVVTDINMPNMDGFALVEAIRREGPERDVPILVLTTETGSDQRERARRAGATGWIVKPFHAEKLAKAIRMVAA